MEFYENVEHNELYMRQLFLTEHHFKKIKSTLKVSKIFFIKYNFEVVQDKAKFLIIKYLIFNPLLSCCDKYNIKYTNEIISRVKKILNLLRVEFTPLKRFPFLCIFNVQ